MAEASATVAGQEASLVSAIYSYFQVHDLWPTFEQLDYDLNRAGISDTWEVLRNAGTVLLYGFDPQNLIEPSDTQQIGLTLEGLRSCPAAGEDLALFAKSVAVAARIVEETPPPQAAQLESENLAIHMALPAAGRVQTVKRLGAIWATCHLNFFTSMSTSEVGWAIVLHRRGLRPFRAVATVDEFFEVLRRREVRPPTAATTRTMTGDSGATYQWFPDEILGAGGYGTVYAATNATGDALVVKLVPIRDSSTERWYVDGRITERELEVSLRLANANVTHVIKLVDHTLTDQGFAFVMPRADYSLFDKILRPDEFSIDDLWDLLEQLATGLQELHDLGIIHRDIKPGNALYLQGRWVWTDVGIARLLDATTSTYTLAGTGTWEYWAPELFEAAPATVRSDIYALGCTILEAITGNPIFGHTSLKQRHQEEPPDFSGVDDPQLSRVLTAMTAKSPSARPRTADALLAMVKRRRSARNQTATLSPGVPGGLQRIEAAFIERDNQRYAEAAEATRLANQRAEAVAAFQTIWSELLEDAQLEVANHRSGQEGSVWWLDVGDRRLRIELSPPARATDLILLGTLSVWEEGTNRQSQVANLAAYADSEGLADWLIIRARENMIAAEHIPVTCALSDQYGALSFKDLERVLLQRGHPGAPLASLETYRATADFLSQLFVAEAEAFNDLE